MNRVYLLLLFGLLGGCIIVTPDPTPTPTPPIKVLEAVYSTDVSVSGQPAICDNRPTQVTYRFRYEGDLQSWTSYFRGVTLGQTKGERTFTPGASDVTATETNGYEVTYTLPSNYAPYAEDTRTNTSKAITVVPVPQPQIIGQSILYLILQGTNGETAQFTSQPMPVIVNCPTG